LIPKKKRFFKYVKGIRKSKSKYQEYVARYYKCSNKEADEYIAMLGDDWAKNIKKEFGQTEQVKKTTKWT